MFLHSRPEQIASQAIDQRLPGEIWSDHITNLKSAANAAGVVSRYAARLANERPEDFQVIIGTSESVRQQAVPAVEQLGEMATERLVTS